MNKVKLTKEVAEAYECARKLPPYRTDQHFIIAHATAVIDAQDEPWGGGCEPLNKVSLFDMADILRYGYEVEETPEDKVREWVKEQNKMMNGSAGKAYDWQLDGALHMLKLLNIKIEGVNT